MILYVGNLPFKTTDDELRAAFEVFGAVVLAGVVRDRTTGRSKGFGFVEMSRPEEARAALLGTDNQLFMGRPLKVNEARPRPPEGRGAP